MNEFKIKYGEVLTSSEGVDYLLDQLPVECWKNPNLTWLDVGAGTGNIINVVIQRLHCGLSVSITDYNERDKYIRNKMIFMSELNKYHHEELLKISNNLYHDVFNINETFDIVISNPPYVMFGEKKTPSKKNISKKKDGKTVWPMFVEKIFYICNLYCSLIIPPLWMRNNPGNARETIVNNLYKCRCLNYYEANKIFFKNGQTPVSFVTLSKDRYPAFYFDKKYMIFHPNNNILPMKNYKIFQKLIPYINDYGCIKAIKTNLPSKNIKFSDIKSKQFPHKNIKTTLLTGVVYNYSNKPLHHRFKKIVLAHKAIGLAFVDHNGLGLSTRDNYIIESTDEILLEFLQSEFVQLVFDSFRFRMRFLEREAFLYLPRVDLIPDFPDKMTNKNIFDFFKIDSNGIKE